MKALALVALAALAQECPPSSGIDARNAHAMFFDTEAGRVLLFGGADACRVRGDTWAWDGTFWRLVTEAGPGPRTFPAVGFDGGRGEAILFGGNTVLFGDETTPPSFLDDTWRWRDAAWSRVEGKTRPPPRAEAAMAYDPERRRMVLFGGYRLEGSEAMRLGDTWEWGGSGWREISSEGPAPSNGAVLVYSPPQDGLVLLGGSGARADTWLLDGESWRPLEIEAPTGTFNPAAVFDPLSDATLRFGGWNGETRVGETWLLSREEWRHIDIGGPSARNHAAMAYDPARRRVVLYGGHDGSRVFGDTWEWDGRSWHLVDDAPPQTRIDNGH